MNRVISILLRTVGGLTGFAYIGGTALAHGGQHGGTDTGAIAFVLFAAGACVLGVSALLDRVGTIERRLADAGVFLGLLTLVTGVAFYWL